MNVTEKLMTVEEFAQMPNDGKKYELVEGVPVEVCRPKPIHGIIQLRLGGYLMVHIEKNNLGKATVESGYITHRNPDSLRGPDVAFISTERLGKHDLTDYVPTAPDLAVEIVSEFDTPAVVDAKVNEYLAAGAKLVWVVYPDTKRIGIYDDDGHYKGLDIHGELDGGAVVPGFKLSLKDIFRD